MKAAKSVRPRTRSERIACEQTPFPLAAGATGNTGSAAQAGVFVTHEDAQRCRSTIAHSEIKVSARSRSATEREPKLVPGDRQEGAASRLCPRESGDAGFRATPLDFSNLPPSPGCESPAMVECSNR